MWSKTRKALNNRLAESLKGVVAYNMTADMPVVHGGKIETFLIKVNGETWYKACWGDYVLNNETGEDTACSAVVANTRAIADCIESVEPGPQAEYPPRIDGAEDEIEQKSIAQAEELYGKPLPTLVKKQLTWELSVIKENCFGTYFAIAEKLVKRSNENGFTVSTCGAVAASLVAYLLGITDINPLCAHYLCGKCKHSEFKSASADITGFDLPDKLCPVCGEQMKRDGFNISVETLFAEDGNKVPDINLSFARDYRPHVVKHLKDIFGRKQILRVGNVSTLYKYSAWSGAEKFASENRLQICERETEDIAAKLRGVKYDDEPNSSSYVIIPKNMEVFDFCPVSEHLGEYITHFDSFFMCDCLYKLDIHWRDTPTQLKKLEEMTGTDCRTIRLDDEETLRLFKTVDTVGLPELDFDSAMRIVKAVKPVCFSELIKIYGLRQGGGTWDKNAEKLISGGTATIREVISSSDDVFIYLRSLGINRHDAYTVMEFVRKGRFCIDSGMNNSATVLKRRTAITELLRNHKVPDWYIESMNKIEYLCPKAYASECALQAFRVAWYKAHYPSEFNAVILNRTGESTF